MPFDRAMAAQIYARMEKGMDGQISEEEFIKVWTNAEKNIKDQIARNKAEILKATEQKKEIEARLREYTAEEKRVGGFANSKLLISIMDAQLIPYDTSVVTSNFGETPQISSQSQGQFPIYNSQFEFAHVDFKDVIELRVTPGEGESDEQPAYTASLKAADLSDQKIHELWLPLFLKNKRTSSKIHITTQYIFSQAQIGMEAMSKWDETITEIEARNVRLTKELDLLYQPVEQLAAGGNAFLGSAMVNAANPLRVGSVDNNTIENVLESKFIEPPTRPIHPAFWGAFIFGALLLCTSALSMDYRFVTLIDLCVGFMLLAMYLFEEIGFTLWGLIATFVLAVISFVIEIVWRRIYPSNWWQSVYIDDGSLVSFRRYQSSISFFSLIFKAILVLLLLVSIFFQRSTRIR